MITVHNLEFSYGEMPVFSAISFSVWSGQKVGLVGDNGAGKSTLFKLLTGQETQSNGTIEVQGSVTLVPQEIRLDPVMEASHTVREYVDPDSQHQDFALSKMLRGLELGEMRLERSPHGLSGGQKTKLALARALLSEPDILLLDEPTNFMDEAGKRWVMRFLSTYPKTLILISHDLALMNRSIDKVLYLNAHTHQIEEYKGNYSAFRRLQAEHAAHLKRKTQAEQKHIRRMEESLKVLYRKSSDKGVRQRVMLQRRIDRAKQSLPDLPPEVRKIKFSLPDPLPVGELPIRAIGICKRFGSKQVLDRVDFSIKRGERIAIIGHNGAGKSTLIKILMGLLEPDSGEVWRNEQLAVGYYSQEFETFDLEKTLLETAMDYCKRPEGFARPFLGRFNFLGNKAFQKVKFLSGGEKTRLAVALLAGKDNNLLILDEPTTYLDVVSQRVILETLKEYKGSMIIVSHTEDFVAELKPERAFLMPENKMVYWEQGLMARVSEL